MMILKTSRANLSSNDQLSLDLPFAATKSLTARVGPTPTFTRASSATFVGSNGLIQTAATNIPRFDHTAAGVCRGLLIEESRTNLLVRSEEFNDAAWIKINASVTANSVTSPSGTLTADTLVRSGTSIALLASADLVAGAVSLTSSLYAKAGTQNFLVVQVNINNGTSASFITFDLTNGTVGTRQDLINSIAFTAVATNVGNGWYRCSVTFTGGSTNSTVLFGAASNANNRDGTNGGTIFIWGAQLEAGSFATSYIPTTTGSLARSADVCSIANTASFWNSDQFTLLGNANFPNPAHDAYAANFSITSGFFGVRRPNNNTAAAIIRSSGVNADISLGTFVTGTMRMAVAHSSGQQAAAFNGGSATQTSSAFSPSLNPALNIGYSGTAGYINGHIAAIRYYKKRLPNAKLVTLTT
jgi:hypothetical protein